MSPCGGSALWAGEELRLIMLSILKLVRLKERSPSQYVSLRAESGLLISKTDCSEESTTELMLGLMFNV